MSKFPIAKLEDWYRQHYFTTEIDISGSGVEDFSLKEVRELAGISHAELDSLVMRDSRTLGDPVLRQSIANRYADAHAERVMITNGSSEAIFLLMKALLSPGDELVILDPHYHSYFNIALTIGCRISRWPLRFEDGFVPMLSELERVLSPQTKMVIVNFPHNPTGASLSQSEQRRLVDMVAAHGAYLIWDMAFEHLIYGPDKLIELNGSYQRVIAVRTLSKAYGLPGIRVGWCIAPPEVFEECIRVRDFTVLFMSPLVELIAEKVIDAEERFVRRRFEQASRNLGYVTRWLETLGNRVEYVKPNGGVTVFPRFLGVRNVDAFCTELLAKHNVLLCPGSCFERSEFVRLGFGCSSSNLETGLNRLSAFLLDRE